MEREWLEQKMYLFLDQMIENGHLKSYAELRELLENTKRLVIQYGQIEPLRKSLLNNWSKEVKQQFQQLPTAGITAGIQLEDGTEALTYGGMDSSDPDATPITMTTRFDSNSLTKLFTATQALKDYELRFIGLNDPLSYYNSNLMQAGTFLEELNFYHQYRTDGHLKYCTSEEEALQKLYQAKRIRSKIHLYDDLPYMMVRQALPDFKEHFEIYFHEILGLSFTGYEVHSTDHITGGRKGELRTLYDPKARVLPFSGHAGIYTTSHDLNQLFLGFSDERFLKRDTLNLLSTSILPGEYVKDQHGKIVLERQERDQQIIYEPLYIKRGMMYRHHGMGMTKTEVLPWTGTKTFAAAGYTGCWCLFDLQNGFAMNLLTNPCSYSETGEKPEDYTHHLDELKLKMLETTIQLRFLQELEASFEEPKKQYQYKI